MIMDGIPMTRSCTSCLFVRLYQITSIYSQVRFSLKPGQVQVKDDKLDIQMTRWTIILRFEGRAGLSRPAPLGSNSMDRARTTPPNMEI